MLIHFYLEISRYLSESSVFLTDLLKSSQYVRQRWTAFSGRVTLFQEFQEDRRKIVTTVKFNTCAKRVSYYKISQNVMLNHVSLDGTVTNDSYLASKLSHGKYRTKNVITKIRLHGIRSKEKHKNLTCRRTAITINNTIL